MKPIAESRALAEENVKGDEAILSEAIDRFKTSLDFESRNRELAEDDIDFLHGDQWPASIRSQREKDFRPCLTFNKLDQRVDQVVGDQRQAKPGIEIHPAENSTDQEGQNLAGTKDFKLSEVMNGIIRAIEQNSDAEIAYNTGFGHAVGHGIGNWRILTEWDEADPFSQVIRIRRIKNAFSVYWDPNCEEPTGADANFCFISSMIPRNQFENQWPDADSQDWSIVGQGDDYNYWYEADNVRIVEYFRRVPVKKIAVKLSTGQVSYLDKEDLPIIRERLLFDGIKIIQEREVKVPKVEWFKLSARDILEREEFPSFHIPVVRCVGKELNVKGYDYYRGLIRHAKDAQRTYNYNRTAQVEQVSLQPKVPMLATPEQIGAYKGMWERMNKENLPYLLYEHVEGQPMPQRQPPPIPSTAHQMNSISDDADIDATTGLYKASLGAPSNEKSGKAIRARQMEGDVGTYTFHSNFHIAIKQTGKILVDMIPRIYDTNRIVRVITPEEEDDFIELNKTVVTEDGRTVVLHDLSAGRYDVRVSAGPSYTTLREEARESMIDFAQALPQAGVLIADMIAENMDWPKASAVAERLKKMLPPGLADDNDDENEITPQMVEQAVQQAIQQTQEQLENKIAMMEADTKAFSAEEKAKTDELKVMIEAAKVMQDKVLDEDKIKDIIAQSIAELIGG